jgi:pimeloyl-ACP methyl ester carboxylesterase
MTKKARTKKMAQPVKRRRLRRLLWVAFGAVVLFGLWQLLTGFFPEEEKELRSRFRETVAESFPEQAASYSETLGMFFFEADPGAPVGPVVGRRSVVLVHGLDDPGKVWRSLAPALAAEGFNVWRMEYPNDQPIEASAGMLYEELGELRQSGVDRISIVGHSMGGLVAREMLTRPDPQYAAAAREGRLPEVDALIMVATPNHGSQLARLRILGEMRDHAERLTEGTAMWLGGILDGAGEAKIDLLPGSAFLTELNARPHPEGVEMLTIAGTTSPWDEDDVDRWADGLSGDRRKWADEFRGNLVSMARGLGDGLVTIESSRMDGVPHLTVDGNHLTMIRNITVGSDRVPPAVPIIVDRLLNQPG